MLLLEDGNVPELLGCYDGNRRPPAALLLVVRFPARGCRRSSWARCSCWGSRRRRRRSFFRSRLRRRRTRRWRRLGAGRRGWMPTLLLRLRLSPGRRGWGLDHLSCRSRHSAWIAPIAVIVCTSGPTDGHRGFPRKRCDRLRLQDYFPNEIASWKFSLCCSSQKHSRNQVQ